MTTSKAAEKISPPQPASAEEKKKQVLDCGKPVNSTQYDHLRGISSRHNHRHIPEPEVAMIFRTKNSPEPDLNLLESQLRKAKKEVHRITADVKYTCSSICFCAFVYGLCLFHLFVFLLEGFEEAWKNTGMCG